MKNCVDRVEMTFGIWIDMDDIEQLIQSGTFFCFAGVIHRTEQYIIYVRDKFAADFALGSHYEPIPK